jgi:23S rRNA pseudouridine1911/1915/1917 synthase
LDAGTSGLLVAAKTAMAYEALVAALAERKIHRQYLGLAVSLFGEATGAIDRPVGRRHGDRKRMGVTRDGRPARTDWRVLLQSDGLALLALTLHSGRTHQIRVHLQSIGHPVLGDADYGWTRSRVLAALAPSMRVDMARAWPARPMLHAARLRLEHPAQPGKFLEFLAPPPPAVDPIAVAFWGDAWREKIAFED